MEKILSGRQIRCLIRSEGDKKLIEFQKDYETNIVLTTIIREVIGDKLIQVGYKIKIFKQTYINTNLFVC